MISVIPSTSLIKLAEFYKTSIDYLVGLTNNKKPYQTTFIRKENGEVNIDYTYVNPILRGQGVAAKMMEVVAEYFRKEGIKATATCSYANIWLKRHEKQYPDILSEDTSDQEGPMF